MTDWTYPGIAGIAWEANRGLQAMEGEEYIDEPWFAAPRWRKELCECCVRLAIDTGADPADTHAMWRAGMEKAGWRRGSKKDLVKKEHPALRSWEELTEQEKLGQIMLVHIVRTIVVAHAVSLLN